MARRTSGKENVVIQNVLARNTFFLHELQILHQIADGEIRRIALAVVAELLPGLEGGDIRHRQLLAAVTLALEDSANQVFVLPGEASKQNCGTGPLVSRERPFHRTMGMRGLVEPGNLA